MEHFTSQRLFLGIDPGQFTGLALWHPGTRKLDLFTTDFWGAIDFLYEQKAFCERDEIHLKVVLEDPNLNKPVFAKKGVANNAALSKIAQNVGQNKRDSQLIAEFLRHEGIETKLVKPTTSKWSKEEFEKITGYTERCSAHARDAAKLVFGL